jgi:hypothetical protein
MLRMHREHKVAAHSDGVDSLGHGLGALTTMDDTGLTVHVWNMQPDGLTSVRANITVDNIPKHLQDGRLAIRRYLIDSGHSNCFINANIDPGLEMVDIQQIKPKRTLNLTADLEPMALCLWKIDKTDGGL